MERLAMTRLVLIRHGETDWNVEGRYQGQADPPLNKRGKSQAAALAEKLEEESRLDVLYSSPLLRAAQTAEVVAKKLDIPLHLEPRFMEIHQGDWQTRLRSEIEGLYPELFKDWQTTPWEVSPPQGETLQQVQRRVYAAVDEIVTRHPEKQVGIVSHRIPIALIKLRYQEGMDKDIVRSLHLPNTYFEEVEVNENENHLPASAGP
jgi:broad specificity phosphatase PhoE